MAFFSTPQRFTPANEEPMKPLTRFKRVHTRGGLDATREGHIDPKPTLARSAPTHQRDMPQAASRVYHKPESPDAALHSSDPIPLDVLRRALPLRAARIGAALGK